MSLSSGVGFFSTPTTGGPLLPPVAFFFAAEITVGVELCLKKGFLTGKLFDVEEFVPVLLELTALPPDFAFVVLPWPFPAGLGFTATPLPALKAFAAVNFLLTFSNFFPLLILLCSSGAMGGVTGLPATPSESAEFRLLLEMATEAFVLVTVGLPSLLTAFPDLPFMFVTDQQSSYECVMTRPRTFATYDHAPLPLATLSPADDRAVGRSPTYARRSEVRTPRKVKTPCKTCFLQPI